MTDSKIDSLKVAGKRQERALESLVEVREYVWLEYSKVSMGTEPMSRYEAETMMRLANWWNNLTNAIHIIDEGYDKQRTDKVAALATAIAERQVP